MKSIGILDTSINSANAGDLIIRESVEQAFPQFSAANRIPTHTFLNFNELRLASKADALFVTGTNILSSFPWPPSPWRFGPLEITVMSSKVVPIGVGWRKYEDNMSPIQTLIYKSIFHSSLKVSVRDLHSARKLSDNGINAIYTACPTMWGLPDILPARDNHNEVVTTLTDYSADPIKDFSLIQKLCAEFDRVLFWPQGSMDVAYLKSLNVSPKVEIIPTGLDSLNSNLENRAYVGTRLHAGIRASQLGSPSLVISIDNRAEEISKDTKYPTLKRTNIESHLEVAIREMDDSRRITMPRENILQFKNQVNEYLKDK